MFTGRKLPLTLAFAVLVAGALGAGCRGFFVKPTLTAITVTPLTPTIQTGTTNNTVQMTATGTYNDGSSNSTPVSWSITTVSPSGTTVAGISTSGLVTSQNQGTATITAVSTQTPSIQGTQTLTVTVGCIQSIAIEPTSATLTPNNPSFPFKAMATVCNDSNPVDISSTANWLSSNTTIATVSAGLVSATATQGADGTVTISASVGNITSNPNATVTVSQF